MCISTSSLTFVEEPTGIRSTPIETITSPNHYTNRNNTSSTPYLPRWAIKTIEATDTNFGDISTGQRTHSHNEQLTNVVLMTRIINTHNI